ncbi:hypothetical protein KSP40_PGU012362 [Platanthera guangdongensis]|uniref:Uncharacterized protein n=1 Tax=Platanthera guangdongensis TaxID=2320717 RepID=A0ABR2N0V3_9ASPA
MLRRRPIGLQIFVLAMLFPAPFFEPVLRISRRFSLRLFRVTGRHPCFLTRFCGPFSSFLSIANASFEKKNQFIIHHAIGLSLVLIPSFLPDLAVISGDRIGRCHPWHHLIPAGRPWGKYQDEWSLFDAMRGYDSWRCEGAGVYESEGHGDYPGG